jgi:hypothetical protein
MRGSDTRDLNIRSLLFMSRSRRPRIPPAGTAVSTSVTYASIVFWPVAIAIDTR